MYMLILTLCTEQSGEGASALERSVEIETEWKELACRAVWSWVQERFCMSRDTYFCNESMQSYYDGNS